jgi:hypothetical protein
MTTKQGLAPVIDEKSRVLILGTLPGAESLDSSITTATAGTSSGRSSRACLAHRPARLTPNALSSCQVTASRCGIFFEARSAKEVAMRRSHNRNRTPLPNCSPVSPLCTELRSTARRLNRCGSLTSSRGLMCRTIGLLRRRSHPQVAAQDDTYCRSKTSWLAGAHSFWHGRNQSVRSSKGAESSANFDARSYADGVPVAPASNRPPQRASVPPPLRSSRSDLNIAGAGEMTPVGAGAGKRADRGLDDHDVHQLPVDELLEWQRPEWPQ